MGMHVELLQLFVPLAEKITVTQFGGPRWTIVLTRYIEVHWVHTHPM